MVNTDAIPAFEVPDLLTDPVVAQRWLTSALREWSQNTGQPFVEPTLNRRDLAALRRVRSDLRRWLKTGHMEALDIPNTSLTVGVTAGRPEYAPRGGGAGGLTALIAMELLLAVQAGVAERLKVCMNDECSAAFYDHSRNASRVWHDVKSCGNVANLRAMRERRKGAASSGATPK